jgi:hypothetical protein
LRVSALVGASRETRAVTEWEYRKIDLNQLPRKTEDIDLLCDVGKDGWELVLISANNVAYLKRQIEEPPAASTSRGKRATSRAEKP